MNIPNRIAEAICNNEAKSEDYFDIYGKENIEKKCAEIYESNEQIIKKYPAEQIKTAITQKLQNNQKRKNFNKKITKIENFRKKVTRIPKKTYIFTNSKVIFSTTAIAILAAIILPTGMLYLKNSENRANSTEISAQNENFRIKGAANHQNQTIFNENQKTEMYLYRKNSYGVQLLEDGDFAKNGDIIQITYSPGKNEYGIIFSIDGNGNITRHFPEKSWESERLSHEKSEIPLDFSYELDNAPNFECFVMVSSKNQFDLNDIEKRIKKTNDLEYLKKLSFLPRKTDGTVFILEK